MLRISNAAGHARRDRGGPALGSARRRERGGVRQSFDARLELDEGAELRHARDAPLAHLADFVRGFDARPGIRRQLLQPEGNLLLVLVDAQHLDDDFLAGLDDVGGIRHA